MLIDETVFFGEIEIGQINDLDVKAEVLKFIEQFEEDYLKNILGYKTFKAFNAGLLEDPINQKWVNLLTGVDYLDTRFEGFVSSSVSPTLSGAFPDDIEIEVGGSGIYDPLPNTSSYTNPELSLLPSWRLFLVGFGPVLSSMATKRPNGFDLIGSTFGLNDSYVIQFKTPGGISVVPSILIKKPSPISYYVYYWYMRNKASFSTGGGESTINKLNSASTTNRRKQVLAWNKMVEMNRILVSYLKSEPTLYPDFIDNRQSSDFCSRQNLLTKINLLNI